MFKNKILFIFKRCKYDDNKILTSKNLFFLSTTSFVIATRPSKFIIKNKLNENNVDIDFSKDISNKKRSTSIFKTFKKKKIKKFNFINIAEINASIYYYLIRNKENKLFLLIINEIYNIINKFLKITL